MDKMSHQLDPLKSAVQSVLRYYTTILIVMIIGFLIFSVYTVNSLLSRGEDQAYVVAKKTVIRTTFDQETADRINELQTSATNPNLDLPNGRISPFTE